VTTANQIQAILEGINLPSREIRCYGSQVTVECLSQETCQKWAEVISKFATVRAIIESLAYTQKNTNLSSNPSTMTVYRLYAKI